MISIIIPTYNREKVIFDSIKSILNQTYSDFELIIVDDGSTDSTIDLIKSITDSRIKLLVSPSNMGATAARNMGIDNARGDYIAFQDSDDFWYENKLEKQLEFLQKNNADLVSCAMETKGLNKSSIVKKLSKNKKIRYEDIFPQNFISTQTILGKRSVFKQNMFNDKIKRYQDWELICRILKKDYKVYFDDTIYVTQFIQEDSITKNNSHSFDSLKFIIDENIDILRENNKKYAGMYYLLGLSKRAENKNSTGYFIKSFKLHPSIMTSIRILFSLFNK